MHYTFKGARRREGKFPAAADVLQWWLKQMKQIGMIFHIVSFS